MGKKRGNSAESYIIRYVQRCFDEAKASKSDRMEQNKENYDVFHMRHDFSHKAPGQSMETLSLQAMAVEQTASFFQQALVDMGDWWSCEAKNPEREIEMPITPESIHNIVRNQLEKAQMMRHVGQGIKSGLLGALIVTKVHGCYKPVPAYVAEKKRGKREAKLSKLLKYGWQLKLDLIPQENYYPDPTGEGLYEIEECYMDYHRVLEHAEGEDVIYDAAVVAEIGKGGVEDTESQSERQRRTGQNQSVGTGRNRIHIREFWGTILDEDGRILHENCVCTIANGQWLIRKPTENPLWHQESPYVVTPVLDADAVWPKALMDAPTKHNIAANEVYNLLVDGGMRSVNGIGQLRTDWLEDPSEVEGGIRPGTTLKVNGQCPPGQKAYDVVRSGEMPVEGLQLFNIINQEFNRSALTSDIRQGMTPRRDVPATQIVETSQTITSVFQGMSRNIEANWIQRILAKSWMTAVQFSDDIDEDEIRSVLTPDQAEKFLAMTAEERFAATVQGVKFRVYGITLKLQQAQDFQKYATILQVIGGSQVLLEEFVKKYSLSALVIESVKSIGIDTQKIELSASEQKQMQASQEPAAPDGPDEMSQVAKPTSGSLEDQLGQAAGPQIPHSKFPESRATPKGGY